MTETHHERPVENHPHWHMGVFHIHPHIDGHHGIAFRKEAKVIHIGENLEEKLAASIEKAKQEYIDKSSYPYGERQDKFAKTIEEKHDD